MVALCNSCNSCNSPEFGIVLHALHVLHSDERQKTAVLSTQINLTLEKYEPIFKSLWHGFQVC